LCLEFLRSCPEPLVAIGMWHEHLEKTGDEGIVELLRRAGDELKM
jgi:predicted phosphoribosyltransferase